MTTIRERLIAVFQPPPHAPPVSPSFRSLAAIWSNAHTAGPIWREEAARLLRREVLPRIGDREAASLTRSELAQLLAPLSPGIANHVRSVLCGVYRHAIDNGLLDCPDPTARLPYRKMKARDRVLSEGELAAIWNACREDDFGRIVRLLLLTGQRRTEVGSLAWSEVEGDEVLLPPSRTKNARAHIVPLTPLARAQLPRPRASHAHLFGRLVGRGFAGYALGKADLDRRLRDRGHKLPPWTLHDLRRSFVTHANEMGLAAPHVIEAFVNHASGKGHIAGIYNRAQHLPERRELAAAWSREVERFTRMGQARVASALPSAAGRARSAPWVEAAE